MSNLFKTKNISLEIKDIDTAGRRVKMALSRFNNIDSDGDIIIKGAFAKSIQERGPDSTSNRKIKFLRYHDFEHQIGIFKQLEETNDHLIAYADLGRSTKGNDAIKRGYSLGRFSGYIWSKCRNTTFNSIKR